MTGQILEGGGNVAQAALDQDMAFALVEMVHGAAEQALAWGMIYQMHEDAALLDEAHKMAARLAGMAGHALVLIRKSLRASAHNDYNTQLDLERDYQGEASRTPDHKEGVAAFLEKRAPKFSGKKA